jgi:hypothetical protein
MSAALDMVAMASEPTAEWGARHAPPRLERPPYTPRELYAFFKGGEPEADRCEQLLAWASRARGGLALGEALDALLTGERRVPPPLRPRRPPPGVRPGAGRAHLDRRRQGVEGIGPTGLVA